MTSAPSTPSNQPPEIIGLTAKEWLQKNLFNSWYNTLLTLGISALLLFMLKRLISWAFTVAKWNVIP
ncbi:MAG: amino acid ABC transporter permease, partial [Planktothrix sp.]